MEYISAMNHGRKITFFKLRKMMKNLYQSVIPQCTSRTPRVGRAVFGCCFFWFWIRFFCFLLVAWLFTWFAGCLVFYETEVSYRQDTKVLKIG